jgi:beta-lactamase class A
VRRRLALFIAVLSLTTFATAAPAYAQVPWQPDRAAAVDYAKHRTGIIGFAVRTEHGFWAWNQRHQMPSASVIKAMILVAYLSRGDVKNRALNTGSNSYDAALKPMITRSDDNATNHVFEKVGFSGLRKLADRVGMKRFETTDHWGRSKIDASDQSLFFLHIDGYMPERHRAYGMKLLNSIVQSQRWGIWEVKPPGWTLYSKGGWGAGTGWVDHQVALLTRGTMRVAVAILTHWDGSHAYGKESLRGLAKRLLHGLNEQSVVY